MIDTTNLKPWMIPGSMMHEALRLAHDGKKAEAGEQIEALNRLLERGRTRCHLVFEGKTPNLHIYSERPPAEASISWELATMANYWEQVMPDGTALVWKTRDRKPSQDLPRSIKKSTEPKETI
jgi:hypothetical protein